MREILFKYIVKKANGHTFNETFTLNDIEYGNAENWLTKNSVGSTAEVFKLQYTGLKDKNGVKIFEGDTGEAAGTQMQAYDPYGSSETVEVLFRGEVRILPSKGSMICKVEVKDTEDDGPWEKHPWSINLVCSRFEVTGNIYETKGE